MQPFKQKTKRGTPTKEFRNIDNGILQLTCSGKDDRLSSLPDNLLISILSLLPTSSAVATSVLSHRWRHLWTYLTHISFKFPWSCDFQEIQNFFITINKVISKLNSPKIHTFNLVSRFCIAQKQTCLTLLGPSVHKICLRNAQVINIVVNNLHDFRQPVNLSSYIFKTQSLVELKLKLLFKFDFAVDAQVAIYLPNLKVLEISMCDLHRRLMHTLFKSCPLLEHLGLHLKLEENDHRVDIIAPNLKFLTIESYGKNYLLLIEAPMLVNLKTSGEVGSVSYHFVTNLRCLQEANIIIPEHHVSDTNSYLSRILHLFQGISCARSLTFNKSFHDSLLDVPMPSFLSLVDLSFGCFNLDSNSLMPSCLLSHVKSLKVFYMKPNDYGIKLLRDILNNAATLERLQVSLCEYDDIDEPLETAVWEEYKFAMKLFNLPKISSGCQIELSGNIITASCEDSGSGQLPCILQNRILTVSDIDNH